MNDWINMALVKTVGGASLIVGGSLRAACCKFEVGAGALPKQLVLSLLSQSFQLLASKVCCVWCLEGAC